MKTVRKTLAIFSVLPGVLVAASCSHPSATASVLHGADNSGPLRFTVVVSDPVAEKSWTASGKLLPQYYDPKLLVSEDDEAALTPSIQEQKNVYFMSLRFYVLMQGQRNEIVPYGALSVQNPGDSRLLMFGSAGFDASDPKTRSIKLKEVQPTPFQVHLIDTYHLPHDAKTTAALLSQPCIFVQEGTFKSMPKSDTVRLGYSDQPWQTVGAFTFRDQKATGVKFVTFSSKNISSDKTPARRLELEIPATIEKHRHRLVVIGNSGNVIHDLTNQWNMNAFSDSTEFLCSNGAYESVKRNGSKELIKDDTSVPSLVNADRVELQTRTIKWINFPNVAFAPKP